MTPLDAATLVAALALGCHWLICKALDSAEPQDLRGCGIVIVCDTSLEAHSARIGEYMGHQIWETVTFRGHLYRFDHVLAQSRREQLAPGELFLDPGLVYVLSAAA